MFVVWLEQPACQELSLSGGKAVNLSRLACHYPVPAGFCVTTHAYAQWAEAVSTGAPGDEMVRLLSTAYTELSRRCQAAPYTELLPVAVRSSAVSEDGQHTSFAGQFATYLNMRGTLAVVNAVVQCWASAQTEQVQLYQQQQANRQRSQQSTERNTLAVLVQQLIPADCSFVAFSTNPISGASDEVMINANWGLGESIVSATATPDVYRVCKQEWQITHQTIAEKEQMTVLTENGVQTVKTPRFLRKTVVLNEKQVLQVAQLAAQLEAEMGYPVDIEGAYQGETLYLLQCRPITKTR